MVFYLASVPGRSRDLFLEKKKEHVMNLVWDPEVPIDVGSKEPLYLTMLLFVDCLEVTIGSPGDK